jgi:hypothetical protein
MLQVALDEFHRQACFVELAGASERRLIRIKRKSFIFAKGLSLNGPKRMKAVHRQASEAEEKLPLTGEEPCIDH